MSLSIQRGASLALLVGLWPALGLSDDVQLTTHEHENIEEIVVTAAPLGRAVGELPTSATVLQGQELDDQLANSIGETLARMPGLADASFGQNVGRPVIRGLAGARVGVLSNSMTVSDASAVSQDHAVSVEPFLADQVEVLRGPATLLYGSGAIGGVVNIVSYTIPQEIPEDGFSGRALLQGNSAANERFAAGRVDFGTSSFAFHADGFYRRTDDYDIPGEADLFHDEDEHDEHDDEDEESNGKLANSFLDNEGGSLGASWIGEKWLAGISYTVYSSDYGIPGAHSHHHEDHDEEGDHDEEEHDEEEHDEEEDFVTINMESRRLAGEIVGTEPFRGMDQVKLRIVSTNYTHTEFEGQEVGTVFNGQVLDTRLELKHNPWGAWEGAFGGQYTHRDFKAIGDEAFVPPSKTESGGVFWVGAAEYDAWNFDLGLRFEKVDIDALDDLALSGKLGNIPTSRSFSPFSVSAGALWQFTESAALTFNIANAERAPAVEELYAFGPHIASQTFEIGDPNLNTEKNFHLEGGLRVESGGFTANLSLYWDNFDDYIYQMNTGLEEDELPVLRWSQQDAKFNGGEFELGYDLGEFASGHWRISAFTDWVSAKLDNGEYVPLIPPNRYGFGLTWDKNGWYANIDWIHASSHTDVAPNETPTPGYNQLIAELSYAFIMDSGFEWDVFLKGHNLLNDDIRYSTSYLRNQAPQIGRNFIFGVRAYF